VIPAGLLEATGNSVIVAARPESAKTNAMERPVTYPASRREALRTREPKTSPSLRKMTRS
jgi:hypothetical protein